MKYPLGQLIKHLTYEEYASEPGIRSSHLKEMRRSMAHYRASLVAPRKETEALAFGRAFHKAMENAENFRESYIVEPDVDRRTKAGKELYEGFYASIKPGAFILKPKWVEPLTGMIGAMLNHKLAANILRTGVKETSLWAEDDKTGQILQCRPDFIAEAGYMVDIKTTTDAEPRAFQRTIWSDEYCYLIQAAHYAHCAKLAGLKENESFLFVAVEKEPPYGISVHACDSGVLNAGHEWREYLMRKYVQCLKDDKWPCYQDGAVPVDIPPWFQSPPLEEME